MQKYYNKDNHDVAEFLIRLALAIVFIHAGWGKLTNMDMTVTGFASIGIPAAFAYLVAIIEFLGGILMLLGAWTKQIAWFFVIIMIGAIAFVNGPQGFVSSQFPLTLLIASLAVSYLPVGRFTYKRILRRE